MDMMTNTLDVDRPTISPDALERFKAALAVVASDQARANVHAAEEEHRQVVGAQKAARDRLREINDRLKLLPAETADDLAAALIAGSQPRDAIRTRSELTGEAARLSDAIGALGRREDAARRKVGEAKTTARRPYVAEAAKLIEDIADTAREHILALASCYAAALAIQHATDVRGAGRTLDAMREMLSRAQARDADLLVSGQGMMAVPADAQDAMSALAALGAPFDFQVHASVTRP